MSSIHTSAGSGKRKAALAREPVMTVILPLIAVIASLLVLSSCVSPQAATPSFSGSGTNPPQTAREKTTPRQEGWNPTPLDEALKGWSEYVEGNSKAKAPKAFLSVSIGHTLAPDVAISPGGILAASWEWTNLKIWDTAKSSLLVDRADINVDDIRFIDDSTAIVMTYKSRLFALHVPTGREHALDMDASAIAWAPAARRLIYAKGSTITMLDLEAGKRVASWEAAGPVRRIAASADGTIVTAAVAGTDASAFGGEASGYREAIELWDLSSGWHRVQFELSGFPVETFALSPDGRYLVCNADDDFIGNNVKVLVDVRSGEAIKVFPKLPNFGQPFSEAAFSTDSASFYSYGNPNPKINTLQRWNAATGDLMKTYGEASGMNSFRLSADGLRFAGARGDTVLLGDLSSGAKARELGSSVNRAVILGEGGEPKLDTRHAAVEGIIAEARTRHPESHRIEYAVSGSMIALLVLFEDVRVQDQLQLWSLGQTPRLLRSFTEGPNINEWSRLGFSPDGRLIAYERGVFDVATGAKVALEGYPIKVNGRGDSAIRQVFSEDSKLYALYGRQGLVVRELSSGKVLSYAVIPEDQVLNSFSIAFDTRKGGVYIAASDLLWLPWGSNEPRTIWKSGSGKRDSAGMRLLGDGKRALIYGLHYVELVSLGEGSAKLEKRWNLPNEWPYNAGLSDNGTLSTLSAGIVKTWDSKGRLVRTWASTLGQEWVSWTPDGYFDGSDRAAKSLVFIVRGAESFAIDQFYERFRRPDIIAARLRGEDTGKLAAADITKGFSKPPAVELELVSLDAAKGRALIRLGALDTGGGIDGARLFLNGKAVGDDVRGIRLEAREGAAFSREYDVALAPGANLFRAVAFSRDRTESGPAELSVVFEPPKPVFPRLHVLAAGADEYRNSAYKLNFALADVRGFLSALEPSAKRIFERVEIVTVLGSELTRGRLTAAFAAVSARARPEDVFIFFYAGHGIASQEGGRNEFHFVLPAVTNMHDDEKLKAEGLSGSELRDLVGAIPANKQMILIDACNSGALLEGFATRGSAEEHALAQLQRSAGVALLSASTELQFANEVEDLGHGLFTWALMRGLSGEAAAKDGRITASSLKAYIDDAVPRLAVEYRGKEQFPLAKVSGQDFPVGVK